MNKVLVCHSSKQSSWISCNIISSDLCKAYSQAGFNLATFEELPSKIKDIDTLIFIDNSWFVLPVLNELINKNSALPQIIIHTFGDFISHALEWNALLRNANKRKISIKLIAASKAEADKLQFLVGKNVSEAFFPVSSIGQFDSKIRQNKRNGLKISENECVLFYSGRISLQKNVDKLILYFDSLKKAHPDRKFKLFIAGSYDNFGSIFPEGRTAEGYLFHKIQKVLSEAGSMDIHFLGELPHEEILSFYQAADAYICLSLYHKEDFGVAPSEALRTGLPCLLTRWGGFQAFDAKKFADVEISNFGFNVDFNPLLDFETHSDVERVQSGKTFLEKFGYEPFQSRMNQILGESREFHEFELSNLSKFADVFVTESSNPPSSKDGLILKNNFYHDVFKHFTADKPVTGMKFSWYQDFEACKQALKAHSTIPFSFPYFGNHKPFFYSNSPSDGEVSLRDGLPVLKSIPESLYSRFVFPAEFSEVQKSLNYYSIKSKGKRDECDSLCLVVDSAFLSDFGGTFDISFRCVEVYVFGDLRLMDEETLKRLFPKVNSSDIKVQSIEAFFLRKNFKCFFYCEIINKDRILDSFTLHFALARCAVEWSTKKYNLTEVRAQDLSMNHQIIFYQG